MFAGDTYLGDDYCKEGGCRHVSQTLAAVEEGGLGDLTKACTTIINLETTVTQSRLPAPHHKRYLHRTPPQRLTWLNDLGVDAASLANNHAFDFGGEGLSETRRRLDAHEIGHFGGGNDAAEAAQPLGVTVGTPATQLAIVGAYWRRPRYEQYGFYAGARQAGVNPVDRAIDWPAAALRVVFVHWGSNYQWRTETQQELAHRLIDEGADLVVGHGAHQLQEVERYHQRWIIYGLGNFVFLTPGRFTTGPSHGALLELTFDGATIEPRLRLVASDNRSTAYTPHLLNGPVFDSAIEQLRERSCSAAPCGRWSVSRDTISSFVTLAPPVERNRQDGP